ncbi:hypothetical protein D9M71_424850 [compost metagenome]
MRLLVSWIPASGVRVAVQVMPSEELRPLRTPLATMKSPISRPVTASLKVMVTLVVSPTARLVSATTMVAVGRRVSTPKLFEVVVPTPVLPAASCTSALFRTMKLPALSMLLVGVRVAVQVMPPSEELRLLRTPLATVKSLMSRPVTTSLKVMVTLVVSPAARVVSATTIMAVGRTVSMA